MPPILSRPMIRRRAVSALRPRPRRVARPAVPSAAVATRTLPKLHRVTIIPPAPHPTVPVPAAVRLPMQPAPSPFANWRGPNPHVDFTRTFTDAGGIRLAFKVKDPQLWRTVIRVILWLVVMAATVWFVVRASPYPLMPRGCGVSRTCPDGLIATHGVVNAILGLVMAGLCAWILFVDDETMASIEIRPDCMIVDDADLYWRDRMDLGWPKLVPGPDGATLLRGVYGTREIDYLTLHAFDEKDRAIPVLGALLEAAMKQLWDQPNEPNTRRANAREPFAPTSTGVPGLVFQVQRHTATALLSTDKLLTKHTLSRR